MIECATVRSSFERVGEIPTRRYRAHRDTRNAVRPFCVLLVDTMPMHSGAFSWFGDGVIHGDLDGVSPIGFDQRLYMLPSAIQLVDKKVYLPPGIGH